MKKILILVNDANWLYKLRKEVIFALLEEGFKIYLSTPNGTILNEFTKRGCIIIETKLDRRGLNPISDLQLLLKYKEIIKTIQPDVVLSYTIKPNIYGGIVASKYKKKYIANITGLGTAVENEGVLQKIAIVLYKIAFRNINCVFMQNSENFKFFRNHNIAKDKLKLIPGSGVNLNEYQILEYPKGNTEFVFISRIMKEKGIDYYLEAAEYIHKKNPEIKFHVCGFCEEEYETRLNSLEKDGIIQYHGMVDDIREVLKVTCATIHPTYYPEGISNVLLESAACARPIITTDRSGCREVVDDGVNGYVIKQRDTRNLIEAIEKFIDMTYEEKVAMGLNGRRKVELEFDRKIVVEKYLEEIVDT